MLFSGIGHPAESLPRRDLKWSHYVQGWTADGTGIVYLRSYVPPRLDATWAFGVAVAGVDGSTRRGLVEMEWANGGLASSVSSDGRRIAFTGTEFADPSSPEDPFDIYVVNTDGSGLRNLTNTGDEIETAPRWGPDGRTVSFERSGAIFVLDVEGGRPRQLARGSGAQWSPDGERIAFTRGTGRTTAVFSIDRDGSNLRRLTPADGSVTSGWSPDGSRLLVERLPTSGRASVWVMNVDGSQRRRLAAGRWARWSPEGSRIAFTRRRSASEGGDYDHAWLFAVGVQGGRARSLGPVLGAGYAWAPEGLRLAVTRDRPCLRAGIYIVDLRGRSRSLTNECRIRGGRGSDLLRGTMEPDLVWGIGGNDRIDTNPGDEFKWGWGGDRDQVWGGAGGDRIRTGPSADLIYGGPGADSLDGGAEGDAIFGGTGNDVLRGGSYHDRIDGGRGRDRLLGGSGSDILGAVDGARDVIDCGPGRDIVVAERRDRIGRDCERVIVRAL
jgi:dipeptidyl aminopeptidase/acylaminoacyl peptidase